jgi:hypothetical protein
VDYKAFTKDGDWPADETPRGFVRGDNSNQSDRTTNTGFTNANCYINCMSYLYAYIRSECSLFDIVGDSNNNIRFNPGTKNFTIGGTTHCRMYYYFQDFLVTGDAQ